MGKFKKPSILTQNVNALLKDNPRKARSIFFPIFVLLENYQETDQNIEGYKEFDHTEEEVDQESEAHAEELVVENEQDK